MISGTYVLTDSIDSAFDSIFSDVREGSDAVISGKAAFDLSDQSGSDAPTLDESLLERVRDVPEVQVAEGGVDSESTVLIDKKGEAIVGNAPSIGFSIATGDSPFNPLRLVRGEWPGANEIVIDESTAKKEKFAIGEPIRVQAEGPIQSFTISGVIRFGETLSTIGDATLAGFDLPTTAPLRQSRDASTRSRSPRSRASRPISSSPRSARSCPLRRKCRQARRRRARRRRRRTSSSRSSRASCSPSRGSRFSSAAS